MPHGGVDGEAHGGASAVLRAEELSAELLVSLVGHVHFAGAHVLELRVVNALLRNDLASDEEDTSDLEGWLSAEHADLTEGVLAEVVKTLKETFEEVSKLILDGTLVANLLVVEEPEGVALKIDLVHELIEALARLIGDVDVISLEVEEIEGAGRQKVEWVTFLLGLLSGLGLGSSSLGLGLLLLDLEDGLDALLGHPDLAEDSDKLGEGRDASEPSAGLGGSLGEALVEDELEGKGEATSEGNISESNVAADEVVSRKGLVDGSHVSLDILAGLVELGLGDLSSAAKDSIDSRGALLGNTRLHPVEPLVDLTTLSRGGTEKSGVTVSKVLHDSSALRELALGGNEEREFVGGVELLVGLLSTDLIGVDDELDLLASSPGDNLAHLDEDVSNELSVDFLQRKRDTR